MPSTLAIVKICSYVPLRMLVAVLVFLQYFSFNYLASFFENFSLTTSCLHSDDLWNGTFCF